MLTGSRPNIVKTAILAGFLYGFDTIPIKIPMASLAETETLILSLTRNLAGPHIAKDPWKRTNLEDTQFPTSKLTTELQRSKQYGRASGQTQTTTGWN